MVKLFAERQQLEEELKQVVDFTQGGSLAGLRMSKRRLAACDVDVCMAITHALLSKNISCTRSASSASPVYILLYYISVASCT